MKSETKTGAAAAKRPRWVWVISIFFFLSAGWTLLSFLLPESVTRPVPRIQVLIHAGAVALNAAQVAYFDSLTAWDYASSLGIGLANLTGAITLFLLRKAAFYLFAFAFSANLLLTSWHVATKGWFAAMSGAGLVGAVIGLGLLFAVCAYSRRLLQQGVLR